MKYNPRIIPPLLAGEIAHGSVDTPGMAAWFLDEARKSFQLAASVDSDTTDYRDAVWRALLDMAELIRDGRRPVVLDAEDTVEFTEPSNVIDFTLFRKLRDHGAE